MSPRHETRTFEALASGLDARVAWLRERHIDAAVMEGTGIDWLAPFEALEKAGIPATLVDAGQVKPLRGCKSDVADRVWLARVCQLGLATASHVPPKAFREMRVPTRYWRTLIGQRSQVLDRSGVRVGGVLSDVFASNGRRILDGLAQGGDPDAILPVGGSARLNPRTLSRQPALRRRLGASLAGPQALQPLQRLPVRRRRARAMPIGGSGRDGTISMTAR